MRKGEICRLLKVSPPTFEELLNEGRLPAPIWLGPTTHSRRSYAADIYKHLGSLAATSKRAAPTLVHA
jgi:excisionase family DNA binding protein